MKTVLPLPLAILALCAQPMRLSYEYAPVVHFISESFTSTITIPADTITLPSTVVLDAPRWDIARQTFTECPVGSFRVWQTTDDPTTETFDASRMMRLCMKATPAPSAGATGVVRK